MSAASPRYHNVSKASKPIHLHKASSHWNVELSLLDTPSRYTVVSGTAQRLRAHAKMSNSATANTTLSLGVSPTLGLEVSSTMEVSRTSTWNYSFENSSSVNGSNSSTMEPYTEGPFTVQDYVLIVLYTATTLLAILGNSLAIVIFTKGKRSKTDLRPFLINLAVADLIMAIFCIPFTFTYQLRSNWVFSRPMCPIVMFLQIVSVTGSVSTNMAIGIDRFFAIAFPLSSARSNPFRYRLIILCIWIIAIAFAGVQLFVGDTQRNPINSHTECIENWPNPGMAFYYTILVLILTYLVPVIILTVTYSIVGYLLWKRNLPGNADVHRDQAQLKSKLKIVKMLVTIVVLFVLCWLPIHTFFLVLNFTDEKNHTSLTLPYFICHWVAMSNSFVNPIVYGFLNDSFRADLKTILKCLSPIRATSRTVRQGAVKFKSRSGMYTVASCPGTPVTRSSYMSLKYCASSRSRPDSGHRPDSFPLARTVSAPSRPTYKGGLLKEEQTCMR